MLELAYVHVQPLWGLVTSLKYLGVRLVSLRSNLVPSPQKQVRNIDL